jgi:hypothetical protein
VAKGKIKEKRFVLNIEILTRKVEKGFHSWPKNLMELACILFALQLAFSRVNRDA